ncbi:MAG TPA: ATP-binding protein [Ignavibacteriaceae bacterium]|nr:ATP-binding protein [Ignavibacteriaceae bacterium]
MPQEKYTLAIESNSVNLLTVEEFVNYFSVELGVPESKIQNILLAVTEAVTNAIIHGNKSNPDKLVFIEAHKFENDLIITIKDQGNGFNPDVVPDPTEPENLLKDSGRGLYLMKVYMDDVKYKITPEGTETILLMHIDD